MQQNPFECNVSKNWSLLSLRAESENIYEAHVFFILPGVRDLETSAYKGNSGRWSVKFGHFMGLGSNDFILSHSI